MEIKQRFQCSHCSSIVEEGVRSQCDCGKIKIQNGCLISESVTDYKDISPRLLNG